MRATSENKPEGISGGRIIEIMAGDLFEDRLAHAYRKTREERKQERLQRRRAKIEQRIANHNSSKEKKFADKEFRFTDMFGVDTTLFFD